MTSAAGGQKISKGRQASTPPRRVLNRGKSGKKSQPKAPTKSQKQEKGESREAATTASKPEKRNSGIKAAVNEEGEHVEVRVLGVSSPVTEDATDSTNVDEKRTADCESASTGTPAPAEGGEVPRDAVDVRSSSSGIGLSKLVAMLLDPMATVEDGRTACVKIADLCTAGTRRNKMVQDALFSAGTPVACTPCRTNSPKVIHFK
jgi:hypothetical protein